MNAYVYGPFVRLIFLYVRKTLLIASFTGVRIVGEHVQACDAITTHSRMMHPCSSKVILEAPLRSRAIIKSLLRRILVRGVMSIAAILMHDCMKLQCILGCWRSIHDDIL